MEVVEKVMKQYRVAVVGATGMVGRKFLQVLEERKLPVSEYFLFASKRSAGTTLPFMGREYTVRELTDDAFDGLHVDIALFSAGAGTSQHFAPIAAAAGAVVIDNSSCWRMDPDVPLVVPEVNPDAIGGYRKKGIIANMFSIEDAIYKMTAKPAGVLGINRGILEKGMPADINIFHLDKLKVHADFENPDQYCTGFDYVLVGGEIAVKQDEYRNPQSGRIVRGCNK